MWTCLALGVELLPQMWIESFNAKMSRMDLSTGIGCLRIVANLSNSAACSVADPLQPASLPLKSLQKSQSERPVSVSILNLQYKKKHATMPSK